MHIMKISIVATLNTISFFNFLANLSFARQEYRIEHHANWNIVTTERNIYNFTIGKSKSPGLP